MTRYWYVAFPPIFVGGVAGAFMLWQLSRRRLVRLRPVVDAAAAIGAGTFCIVWIVVGAQLLAANPRDDAWNEFRYWARTEGRADEALWVDSRGRDTLDLFIRETWSEDIYWTGDIQTFPQRTRIGAEVADDGLLLETLYGPRPRPHEDFGWTRVWTSSDGSLVLWER